MIVVLVGNGPQLASLEGLVRESLEELGLADAVPLRVTGDATYAEELGITQNPALCIEEESIEFKDVIFEGVVPDKAELTSMFLAILGGGEDLGGDGCSSGCSTCSTGCGSHAPAEKSGGCGCGTGACSTHDHSHAHAH